MEKEIMARDNYDRILEDGWPSFFEAFVRERILDDVPLARLRHSRERQA